MQLVGGEGVVGFAAAVAALGRGPARGGGRGGGSVAGWGWSDDGDVEAPAGDLDGVGLLDRFASLRRRRGRRTGSGRGEPRGVFDQIAAGLAVGPLARGEQRLVKRDQRLDPVDVVLAERSEHPRRRLLAV